MVRYMIEFLCYGDTMDPTLYSKAGVYRVIHYLLLILLMI